ncbi:MAG: arsenosugar biosynthesis radical SAM protein ArsS [bacterium]|nr:arsenosugar biosynthesis radical SAM protein ArsS [bacterium]
MNQSTQFQSPSFHQRLASASLDCRRGTTQILQVNLGSLCNQACHHCHQAAGPTRRELMDWIPMQRVLELVEATPSITQVDLTGGAPELNPQFRCFVQALTQLEVQVTNRCNLTVLFEPGQEDTAEWLASNRVQIIASLPCYSGANVDQQRGDGVFSRSIQGLQRLNQVGYGQGPLGLDLVYNPNGAFLPGDQRALEATYRSRLREDYGIEFNQLYSIANMPIRRFAGELKRSGQWEAYQQLLQANFNEQAAQRVMCRNLVSVDYQGKLFDCDFNQALGFGPFKADIFERSHLDFANQKIAVGEHCFGCTAGAGSSCNGALEQQETH